MSWVWDSSNDGAVGTPLDSTGGIGHVRLQESWDGAESVHKIAMLRWDTTLLQWVKFGGPTGGVSAEVTILGTAAVNITQVGSSSISLGQKTMANSFPVVISSDQSAISVDTELPTPVVLSDALSNPTVPQIGAHLLGWTGTAWYRLRGTTAAGLQVQVLDTVAPSKQATTVSTRTEVSVAGVSIQLLASNSSRKKVWLQNHGSGYVRVDLFTSATTSSPIRLVPQVGEYVIMADGSNAVYAGAIFAISESGTNLVGVIEEIV